MGGCQPDPFDAHVVHVGEDCRDRSDVARWFGAPGVRIEIFNQNLVHAIVGGEDPNAGLSGITLVHNRIP